MLKRKSVTHRLATFSNFSATTSGAATPSSGLQPGNGYAYHTFTSPGSITFSQGGEIEVLLVAGGGSSASSSACCVGHGGGGGGGILHGGYTITTSSSLPVVVGPGGAAGAPKLQTARPPQKIIHILP